MSIGKGSRRIENPFPLCFLFSVMGGFCEAWFARGGISLGGMDCRHVDTGGGIILV